MNAAVKRIRSASNRVTGVELTNGGIFDCSIAVSNVDLPTTQTELLGRAIKPPRMTPGVLTFYWGVRGKVGGIVENRAGIGHHTIFLPDDYRGAFDDLTKHKRIPAGLPFYVAIASATDPDLAPAGDSTLFVLVPTPVLSNIPDLDWNDAVAGIRATVLERIQLDPARIAVEHVWTPEDWRDRFGLFDGSAFGAAHTLTQIGPFRSRNYSREIAGLYFTGAGTTPGTGMPMVTLSGRMTAERIAGHLRAAKFPEPANRSVAHVH